MNEQRFLMVIRLVLGALLIRQGALGLSDLPRLVHSLEVHNAWQGYVFVGAMRPMELAIWIAASEFAVGIFLVGGLLTRFMALVSTVITIFSVVAFVSLGPVATAAHAILLVASVLILVKGGGAGTMDRMLGSMQRRSIEREAEREAARQDAREAEAPAQRP